MSKPPPQKVAVGGIDAHKPMGGRTPNVTAAWIKQLAQRHDVQSRVAHRLGRTGPMNGQKTLDGIFELAEARSWEELLGRLDRIGDVLFSEG